MYRVNNFDSANNAQGMTKNLIDKIMDYNPLWEQSDVEIELQNAIDFNNRKTWIRDNSLEIPLAIENDRTLYLRTTLVELIINLGYKLDWLVDNFKEIKKEIDELENKKERKEAERLKRQRRKQEYFNQGVIYSEKHYHYEDPGPTSPSNHQHNGAFLTTEKLDTLKSILISLYLNNGRHQVIKLLKQLRQESPRQFSECAIGLFRVILGKGDIELARELLNKEPGIVTEEILSCPELNRPEYNELYDCIFDSFLKKIPLVRSWLVSDMGRPKIHTDEGMGSERWFEVVKRIAKNYNNDPEIMELLAEMLFSIVIRKYKNKFSTKGPVQHFRLFNDDFNALGYYQESDAKEKVGILLKEEDGIQFSETLFGILTINPVVKNYFGSKLFDYALKYDRGMAGSEDFIKDLVFLGADVNYSKFHMPYVNKDLLNQKEFSENSKLKSADPLDERYHHSLLSAMLRNPDLRNNKTAKEHIAEISNPSGAYGKSIVQACISMLNELNEILKINPDYIGERTLFYTLLPSYDDKHPIVGFTYDSDLIDKLLKNKDAANIYQNGRTPLLAVIRTNTNITTINKIVENLLKAGANPFVLSARGSSCLAYIERNKSSYPLEMKDPKSEWINRGAKERIKTLTTNLTKALDGAKFAPNIGWMKDGSVIFTVQEAIGNPLCGRNESKEDTNVFPNIPIVQDEERDNPHPKIPQTSQNLPEPKKNPMPKEKQWSRRDLADSSSSSSSDGEETTPEPTSPKEPLPKHQITPEKLFCHYMNAQGEKEYELAVGPKQKMSDFTLDGGRIIMKDNPRTAGQCFNVTPEGNGNTFTREFTNYLKSKGFTASPIRGTVRYFTVPKARKQNFLDVVSAFDISQHKLVQTPPSQAASAFPIMPTLRASVPPMSIMQTPQPSAPPITITQNPPHLSSELVLEAEKKSDSQAHTKQTSNPYVPVANPFFPGADTLKRLSPLADPNSDHALFFQGNSNNHSQSTGVVQQENPSNSQATPRQAGMFSSEVIKQQWPATMPVNRGDKLRIPNNLIPNDSRNQQAACDLFICLFFENYSKKGFFASSKTISTIENKQRDLKQIDVINVTTDSSRRTLNVIKEYNQLIFKWDLNDSTLQEDLERCAKVFLAHHYDLKSANPIAIFKEIRDKAPEIDTQVKSSEKRMCYKI